MDKSYIIRVYKRCKESAIGIVEDIEESKRTRFSNANQLWSLITDCKKEDDVSKVIVLNESIESHRIERKYNMRSGK